ncbi:50S ribosomal protein L29 [bacterium]|jgi:large subunit ribosomal protein L29|nr:50S ribosomal protein L29 [bacterium]MBO7127334.1 50S ribosomal protein L29 [bacterium]MBP5406058.1 50S ribosomal protein L29 [bacterium]MBQ3368484.1 50S ribosomal protein L29 [bacterium]MBQ4439121.1 50S ribosomal protein L29 [bacterium]
MKVSELRAKTLAELEAQLLTAKEEQFNLRMQKTMGQLENPSRIMTVRREIAKIKTIITEKKNGTEVK